MTEREFYELGGKIELEKGPKDTKVTVHLNGKSVMSWTGNDGIEQTQKWCIERLLIRLANA